MDLNGRSASKIKVEAVEAQYLESVELPQNWLSYEIKEEMKQHVKYLESNDNINTDLGEIENDQQDVNCVSGNLDLINTQLSAMKSEPNDDHDECLNHVELLQSNWISCKFKEVEKEEARDFEWNNDRNEPHGISDNAQNFTLTPALASDPCVANGVRGIVVPSEKCNFDKAVKIQSGSCSPNDVCCQCSTIGNLCTDRSTFVGSCQPANTCNTDNARRMSCDKNQLCCDQFCFDEGLISTDVHTVTCDVPCKTYTLKTGSELFIQSRNFPNNYRNFENCEIRVFTEDPSDELQFSFTDFDVEFHPACFYDVVSIKNFRTNDVLDEFCGIATAINDTVYQFNALELNFTSDVIVPRPGFRVSFKAI